MYPELKDIKKLKISEKVIKIESWASRIMLAEIRIVKNSSYLNNPIF